MRITVLYWSLFHSCIIIPFNQIFYIKLHNFHKLCYIFDASRGILWFMFVMKGIDQSIKFLEEGIISSCCLTASFTWEKKTFSTFLTKQVGLKLYIMYPSLFKKLFFCYTFLSNYENLKTKLLLIVLFHSININLLNIGYISTFELYTTGTAFCWNI